MTHPVRIYTSEGWVDLATVGPPGPSGPQGIQGIQGPAGATGPSVDTSAFVQKSGDTMTGTLFNNYTGGFENIVLAGSASPGIRLMPTTGATNSSWLYQYADEFIISANSANYFKFLLNTGAIVLTSTVAATSSASGALIVPGGVGIGGRLYVDNFIIQNANLGAVYPSNALFALGFNFSNGGGEVDFWNSWEAHATGEQFRFINRTGPAATTTLLSLFDNSINIPLASVSSAYTNGALIVTGGVGIGGQLNVNGNINGNQAAYLKNTISVGTASLKDGTIYFGSDNTSYLFCNGGGWQFTGSPTGGVYFSNNTVMINSSLTSPTATGIIYFNGSATKYVQYDGNVIVVGGAELYLTSGNPVNALGAAPKQYVDAGDNARIYRCVVSIMASGSGTWNPSAGCKFIRVRIVGGGSGGSGGGNPGATQPGGGNTGFSGMVAYGASGPGGGGAAGGTTNLNGGSGSYGYNGDVNATGGPGGNSAFGGGGGAVAYMNTGGSGASSTGGGGSGGDSDSSNGFAGPGGGAGGYSEHIYLTPGGASWYVGAGGGNGYPGTGGSWGGSGGSGLIIVEAFY